MKKILVVMMMCLMSVGAFASELALSFLRNCTVHYSVIDEEGNTVFGNNFTGDTCEQAIKIARWSYWFQTGDIPNYQS